MAGYSYSNLAATALKLITKFGLTATLKVPSAVGSFDPTVTEAPYACKALVADYTVYEIGQSGGSVRSTDKKVLLAASGLAVEPSAGSTLVLEGKSYKVVSVDAVRPAGTALVYTLQVRA